jgi:ABC-type transport system substrate-binding protein
MHYCKVLPQDRLQQRGDRFFREPSGTGPFKFDSWIRDTRLDIVGVRLVRNEDYYGSVAWLDAVEFCPHFTLDHFMGGQIDSIPVLSDRLLKKDSDYKIFQDGSLFPVYLGMSCHIAPLDDPLVRKAISFGIDKSELLRVTHEAQYFRQLLYSHIPPKLPGFRLHDSRSTYSLVKAEALFRRAGFSEEERPQLTLLLKHPRTDFKIKFHRELRRQMRNLNIELKITYYRSMEEVKRFDRPFLILQGKLMDFPDPVGIIRPMFFSQSPDNVLGFLNPELDNYLEQAEIEHSWTKRNKLFLKIDELLQLEIPSVPLYMQQNQVAMQPYVRGVEVPPMGLYYLKARNIWYEKEE